MECWRKISKGALNMISQLYHFVLVTACSLWKVFITTPGKFSRDVVSDRRKKVWLRVVLNDDQASIDIETTRVLMYMPEEVVLQILSSLPVKSLLQFRSVSKRWKSIIDDPWFVDLHLARGHSRPDSSRILMYFSRGEENYANVYHHATHFYSASLQGGPAVHHFALSGYTYTGETDESFSVLGSINGLLLLSSSSSYTDISSTYICNPSTRKLIMLPPFRWLSGQDVHFHDVSSRYHFGFDQVSKQYKVLHIYKINYKKSTVLYTKGCEVYTLGDRKGWRSLGDEFDELADHPHFGGYKSVCVNGAIHWISTRVIGEPILVAFDLEREKYRFSPLPRGYHDHDLNRLDDDHFDEARRSYFPYNNFDLAQAGGRLALLLCSNQDPLLEINMWVLKDYENHVWINKKVQLLCCPKLLIYPKPPTAEINAVERLLDPRCLPLDDDSTFTPNFLKERDHDDDGLVLRVGDLHEYDFEYVRDFQYHFHVDCYFESLVSLDGGAPEEKLDI